MIRLLFVDDELVHHVTTKAFPEMDDAATGCNTCSSAREILEKLAFPSSDAIVSDDEMLKMDGDIPKPVAIEDLVGAPRENGARATRSHVPG